MTNEASKLEAQMAPVVRYVNGLADASGKVSDAIADNGKTFKQNYSDMENYIQRLSMDIPRTHRAAYDYECCAGSVWQGRD